VTSLRERWWDTQRSVGRWAALTKPRNRAFGAVVLADRTRFVFGAKPVRGQTRERARAAAAWLARAQDATPDDGVSYGYFPCEPAGGWDVSYPETTGYIIPSLIAFAHLDGQPALIDRAQRMARWEAAVQMKSGAVQGGKLATPDKQTPATFNTGMVLHGFSAAYRESRDAALLAAGRRAADFLFADLNADGYFRTNGEYVSAGVIKVYNCLCGWALYLFGQDAGDQRYLDAAIRAAEGAVRKQSANGWIADNCLNDPNAPLTHTIGYTLQGLIEIGTLARRGDLVEAARKGVEPLVARLPASGRLYGRYRSDWSPALRSTCLTGSAQIAIVLYRLTEELGDRRWAEAAHRIVDFLKAMQVVDSSDPGVNGALAGSFPIFGEYMTGGYPNWATKYFLDALMLQEKHGPP
jgi:uncharacterized protein YyaL (SSP411 family)